MAKGFRTGLYRALVGPKRPEAQNQSRASHRALLQKRFHGLLDPVTEGVVHIVRSIAAAHQSYVILVLDQFENLLRERLRIDTSLEAYCGQ